MICRYVISEWRSIRPVESHQYDITMGNDIARNVHYKITMGNDIARDIHCDITMRDDVAMCTYHGITMHNDLFYVVAALCLIMILLWVVCRTHSLFLCRAISLILRTCEISLHKHNSCVLPRLINHSLVFVI